MLTLRRLTPAAMAELEFEICYQLGCQSCNRNLYLPVNGMYSGLAASGWMAAETQDQIFDAICPNCINELQEIEAEMALIVNGSYQYRLTSNQ